MNPSVVWLITAATVMLILLRPRGWPEAVWSCAGAAMLVLWGALSPARAAAAAARGSDVYLFLAGMMLLSELARRHGVLNWLAEHAVSAARGSRLRLFGLVYATGVLVTVFLSNDATAVVLTPAVYAALRKAESHPMPDLFACALVANAASFVLPISNPANLVVYGAALPALLPWFRAFLLPSLAAIAITYLLLWLVWRKELTGAIGETTPPPPLHGSGKRAAWALLLAAFVLVAASASGARLGLPVIAAAVVAGLIADDTMRAVRSVAWGVLPLVAGLFIIVESLDAVGAIHDVVTLLQQIAALPGVLSRPAAAFAIAVLSNLVNNLPAGLLAGQSLAAAGAASSLRSAVLVGVDLGPNLSVTGSLATILWLIALRREGLHVSTAQFLRTGLLVMPPALLAAALVVA
jgi:arsenical pump membrane protein